MPETPEMVERVRRALDHALGAKTAVKIDTAFLARVAIQTMREPTEAITKAWDGIQVLSSEGDWNEWLDMDTASRVWTAGIDAALTAPEEGREP